MDASEIQGYPANGRRGEAGFTMLELIGVLAVLSILAALMVPTVIQQLTAGAREAESQRLTIIGQGVKLYMRVLRDWPGALTDLSPDYVPFADAQVTNNDHGFPRYFVVHPNFSAYDNQTGAVLATLGNARFLVISNLTVDAAPNIVTAADFDTWWNLDETPTPDLKLYRGHIGDLLFNVNLSASGVGASFRIDGLTINAGGGVLAHDRAHVLGTPVALDESDPYDGTPELQFSLANHVGFQFRPECPAGMRWKPQGTGCP